ncbi:MAG: hypothetical protein JO368_11480 [Acidimicrobiales bacterium]|nr:hypothetical protein [Acidimicrobiales bacterium]
MSTWPALPYEAWRATCDTLHAHTQLLGKLCVALAPPEPELQHAALRLTARGWETPPLPAPDGSGALVALLDLHRHQAVLEHSDRPGARVPLTPHRSVGEVTRELLGRVESLVGAVEVRLNPQEVAWTVPLDEDEEHHTYDTDQVEAYLAAATRAALALAAVRAPYRGRSTPVNAWWGSFDLAISLFSGRAVEPPSRDFIMRNAGDAQQVEVGWWPGDARHPQAAFFGYAAPAPDSFTEGSLQPEKARWDAALGEYVFDWSDVIASPDPHAAAVEFGRSLVAHACQVCDWDPALAGSALGDPGPLR